MCWLKKFGRELVLIGLGGVALSGLFACREPNAIQKETRFIMGTVCTIQIPGPPAVARRAMAGRRAVREAVEKAFARLEECDQKFSVFIPSSPVCRFNQQGIPIDDPEIVALIAQACEVSRLSQGAFDITVYPLVELWGFYSGKPRRPAPEEIAAARGKIGWQHLVITNGQVTKKNAAVQIDLGAIAKGYAVDAAMQVLLQNGIHDALIEAGGDIFALGQRNQKPWKIGIRHPRQPGLLDTLEVSDRAIATSGDYEQFFIADGARYHHIFDPRTGYPATNLMSVTVIGANATLADAWSTALFVLGLEKGMKLVEEGAVRAEVLMLTSQGRALSSPGLKTIPGP
ncbi:MAG: FAD:protein FMN transferase [Lentisphaerae bacterium]|nr:FAD:protein FMN transferase [Lentisphaerota bacterium]